MLLGSAGSEAETPLLAGPEREVAGHVEAEVDVAVEKIAGGLRQEVLFYHALRVCDVQLKHVSAGFDVEAGRYGIAGAGVLAALLAIWYGIRRFNPWVGGWPWESPPVRAMCSPDGFRRRLPAC